VHDPERRKKMNTMLNQTQDFPAANRFSSRMSCVLA